MKRILRHPWRLSIPEAICLQRRLAGLVRAGDSGKCPLKIEAIRLIAGADVSYSKTTDTCYAAVVLLRFPDMTVVEERTAVLKSAFPYVPGLLSFREGEPLTRAFGKLRGRPDVLVFDAQGIAHPRRVGLASHMGLIYGIPSIGCAKTILCGTFEEPGEAAGDVSPLLYKGEQVGAVLRTKSGCRPMFISPGHLMDVEWAFSFIRECPGRYRQPEVTRRAHLLSNRIRLDHEAGSNLISPWPP